MSQLRGGTSFDPGYFCVGTPAFACSGFCCASCPQGLCKFGVCEELGNTVVDVRIRTVRLSLAELYGVRAFSFGGTATNQSGI